MTDDQMPVIDVPAEAVATVAVPAGSVPTVRVPEPGVDELAVFASRGGLDRQTELADSLMHFVKTQELSVKIGDGEHLLVEAWQWLGAQLGIFARTVTTCEIRDPETLEFVGYKATVEAVHRRSGDVVGTADAICTVDEQQKRWRDGQPDRNGKSRREQYWADRWLTNGKPVRHSILSMAQTRGTSKALSQALRFVVVMAGYSGTPSEEMAGFDAAYAEPRDKRPRGGRDQGPPPADDDLPRAGTTVRTPPAGPKADQPAPPPQKPIDNPIEAAKQSDAADPLIGRAQAVTLTGIASRRAQEFEAITARELLDDIARQKGKGSWEAMWPRIKLRQMESVSKAIQEWEPGAPTPET